MAGRPPGAVNKDKPFRDALRLEISAAQDSDDPRSLRAIARKLLDVAAGGDVQAMKEVADRLDGKVPQAHIGDDEQDPISMVHRLERVIVDVADRDRKDIPPAA
jgi:hypothetical protein